MNTAATSLPTCPACGYTVGEGAIERCPECGAEVAAFDQLRDHAWEGWLARFVYACSVLPLLTSAAANGLLALARIQLGRWPHRFGMDDPKQIPIVNVLFIPIVWLPPVIFAMALGGVLVWVVLAYLAIRHRDGMIIARRQRAFRTAVIGLPLLIGGIVILFADPWHAFVWLLD